MSCRLTLDVWVGKGSFFYRQIFWTLTSLFPLQSSVLGKWGVSELPPVAALVAYDSLNYITEIMPHRDL